MGRSRNIKPGFFCNEDLVELDFATRILFVGLWTVADREGRLEDRPKKIKINVFPADDVDVDSMLQALHKRGFLMRYEVNGEKYVQITNWHKHQNPHHTEKASVIPDINGEVTVKAPVDNKQPPSKNGGNRADSLIPDSLSTDSLIRSVPKGTANKLALSPDEIIFGYGLPLLTNAGTPEKQARSFLGGLRKNHGDDAVVNALRDCLKEKPLQPLEWLASILPPAGRKTANKQESLENRNRAIANAWAASSGAM